MVARFVYNLEIAYLTVSGQIVRRFFSIFSFFVFLLYFCGNLFLYYYSTYIPSFYV